MSYARFGCNHSNVYIFLSHRGLECCGCPLRVKPECFKSTRSMVNHLVDHMFAGHVVPEHVIHQLIAEDEQNFEWVTEPNGFRHQKVRS